MKRTLLISGWIGFTIGFGAVVFPTLLATLHAIPQNSTTSFIILSGIVVTIIGGITAAIAASSVRLPGIHENTPSKTLAQDHHVGPICDALFLWQTNPKLSNQEIMTTITNIPNESVRRLSQKLLRHPEEKIHLRNIPRHRAEHYQNLLTNTNIVCKIQPPSAAKTPDSDNSASTAQPWQELPVHHGWIPRLTAAFASVGVLWPLFFSPTPHSSLSPAQVQQQLRKTLFKNKITRLDPIIAVDTKNNIQKKVTAQLTLLDIQDRELANNRDQAVVAIRKNYPNLAAAILKKTSHIIEERLGQSPLKDKDSLALAAEIKASLGDLMMAQNKPKQAADYFGEASSTANPHRVTDYLYSQASAYKEAGLPLAAESTLLKALNETKNLLGDNQQVAKNLALLGTLYAEQGRMQEAEDNLRKSLDIQKDSADTPDPSSAGTLHNLATVLANQGKLDDAINLEEQSLTILKSALGPNHLEVAKNLENIANLLEQSGRGKEANNLHEQSDQIFSTQVPAKVPAENSHDLPTTPAATTDDPNKKTSTTTKVATEDPTSQGTDSLASEYYSRGQYQQALTLFQRSLESKEQSLGSDHPDVAASMNNLASILASLGRLDEAEPLFVKSLAIKEKFLDENDLSLATSMNNLAALYKSQGRFDKAEPLQKQTLAIRENALGKNHPEVAISLNNLARIYDRQKRYTEAEPLYKRALAILQETERLDNAYVPVILLNYAQLLRKLNRPFDAEQVETQAQTVRAASGQGSPPP